MRGAEMERVRDARARENPWYFVDNRLDHDAPDLERPWAEEAGMRVERVEKPGRHLSVVLAWREGA